MIDIKHTKCIICGSYANYNFKDQKKGIYCSIHKLDGMICLKKYKTCLKCNKIPIFNFIDLSEPIFCSEHKHENMIDVVHPKCLDCDKRPNYNYSELTQPIYCLSHKKHGMIDITHKSSKCKSDYCDTRVNNKYHNGYCAFCYQHLFPDKPHSKNYKTKEKSVSDFVINEFKEITWIPDQRVQNGCSRRRPDLLADFGDQVIIVEVDENQHIDYDCSYENKRLMEISQDVNHRPIVFIRFNPDKYIDINGNIIQSPWSVHKKNGQIYVSKLNKKNWEMRLLSLKEQIIYWTKHKTDKTVEVIQLFYDQN